MLDPDCNLMEPDGGWKGLRTAGGPGCNSMRVQMRSWMDVVEPG